MRRRPAPIPETAKEGERARIVAAVARRQRRIMEQSVLFVDDEQNVLSSIRRMLIDEPYEQFFASGAAEALDMLERRRVSVIVSDMRMPGTDGVAFLEKSRGIVPDAVRIVLSGQSDLQSVMQAINRGGIWRFIGKPWNDDDMKCTIRNAIDLFDVQQERRRLLEELAAKNAALESMNRELERRVEERTRLIDAQKQLLHRMIEGFDMAVFTAAACEVLADLVGTPGCALLHIVGGETMVHHGAPPLTAHRETLKNTLADNRESSGNGYLAVPVVHASAILGALGVMLHGAMSEERLREVMTSIVPVIALALGQFKMILDAPAMLHDLDDLIDTL